MGRVVDMDRLVEVRERARRSGKIFVFTNGCFDILHRGHIELLTQARAQGDLLAVAVNSDRSVARLKGDKRPIVHEEDRAAVLAALEAVDYVTLFDEDTPAEVISVLRPDVLVKGSDYDIDEIVGRAEVEEMGGRVVRIPLHGGFSTERLLREIARRYSDTPSASGT
jgi:rfaE bifunctional protein nucleotidyltransferase chain/domain